MMDAPSASSNETGCRRNRSPIGTVAGFSAVRSPAPKMRWQGHPNLRRRPPAPALGRGRLQRQVRRAFLAGGPIVSSSEVYDWTIVRNRRMRPNLCWSVLRILRVIAVPVGRASTIGQPLLWRLKPELRDGKKG